MLACLNVDPAGETHHLLSMFNFNMLPSEPPTEDQTKELSQKQKRRQQHKCHVTQYLEVLHGEIAGVVCHFCCALVGLQQEIGGKSGANSAKIQCNDLRAVPFTPNPTVRSPRRPSRCIWNLCAKDVKDGETVRRL